MKYLAAVSFYLSSLPDIAASMHIVCLGVEIAAVVAGKGGQVCKRTTNPHRSSCMTLGRPNIHHPWAVLELVLKRIITSVRFCHNSKEP